MKTQKRGAVIGRPPIAGEAVCDRGDKKRGCEAGRFPDSGDERSRREDQRDEGAGPYENATTGRSGRFAGGVGSVAHTIR